MESSQTLTKMAATNKVTILDTSQVTPSPGSVPELTVPLTCSDMVWIGFTPVHRVTFYDHPVSKPFFLETIIPGLKNSLSLALKHFPSVSGNLIMLPDSTIPEIRYLDGDSVPFTIAVSNTESFEYLVSNQPRICSEFYPLIPQLPYSTESGGSKMYPLIAFQVTLFPVEGFCIGITHNHVLGDGTSTYAFIKAWSTICKFGEDEAERRNELSPIYDREVMRIHTGELDETFWRDLRNMEIEKNNMVATQLDFLTEDAEKVRTTFLISPDEIKKLKQHVLEQQASSKQFSTFTVVCGYVWTCLIKSRNATMNEIDDEEQQYLIFAVDCRRRTDPLVPENYFGNCLAHIMMSAENIDLSGEEGFVTATELIRETIQQKLQYNGGVLKSIETLLADMEEVKDITKLMSIAGSPRQNHYNVDFGWGKPRKVEVTSIDSTGAISLSGSRDDSGSLEIGLALKKIRMDAFSEIFRDGLHAL